MSKLIFYVYEHWRPDTGVCFYVGKGKGKRAWDLKNMRNRYHKAVTSKLLSLGLSVDVRMVLKDLTAEAAYALEISRIALYAPGSLTNMTAGGDGFLNPTAETRAKMSTSYAKRFGGDVNQVRDFMRSIRPSGPPSTATRAKLSAAMTGRVISAESLQRISTAAKARGMPRATIDAAAAANRGRPRVPHSPESKELMRVVAIEREARKRALRSSGG